MDYSTEDNEKALEVLTDLVKENSNLKGELQIAHTFILAQLLASKDGEIVLDKQKEIHNEDLEAMLPYIKLHINLTNNSYLGDKFQGRRVFASIKDGTNNGYYVKRTTEELLLEFEKRRYKDED